MNSILEHPVYGDIFRYATKPKYGYRVRPAGAPLHFQRPPRINKIFDGVPVGGGRFGNFLQEAAETVARRSERPTLFSAFGWEEDEDGIYRSRAFDFANIQRLLITGASGWGKSYGAIALILSMLWGNHPKLLRFTFFDLKGTLSEFARIGKFYGYKQAGVKLKQYIDAREGVKNKKKEREETKNLFVQAGNELLGEMEKRIFFLKKKRCKTIKQYNQQRPALLMPYQIVVIDEYQSTAAHFPEFAEIVETLTCMGRGVGLFFILLTQRADSKAISSRIKANVTNDYSFRQRNNINEQVAGVFGTQDLDRGQGILQDDYSRRKIKVPTIPEECLEMWVDRLAHWRAMAA